MTPVFSKETDADGVAVLTLDVPGEKHNILDKRFMAELGALLTEIEGDLAIKAVVLCSGKAESFSAGADLHAIGAIRSADEAEALSRVGQELTDRVAALRVPVVVAIHGLCLGGDTELALACRYRIASSHPTTALSLPEVRLGLIPGAGGTQRLPRIVGLAAALDLIVSGRPVSAERALRLGLINEVVPASSLLELARRRALGLVDGSVAVRRPRVHLKDRLLSSVVAGRARAMVAKKLPETRCPAPYEAIKVATLGLRSSLAEGLALERAAFGRMAVTDAARAQVGLFFAVQGTRKDAGFPEGTATVPVERLGVIGAGHMGAGIAGAAVAAGIPVRLRDGATEGLGKGLAALHSHLEAERHRGRTTRLEVARVFDRVSPTLDWTGFKRVQFVIEAVPEDLGLKRRILEEAQAATNDDCIFGSCTSALPIRRIAEGARRPSRVVGMHFLSPVQKVPLLEVVASAETDAATVATAVALGRRLGKHTIVVRDGPGFYTTRSVGEIGRAHV
jgi:3-hydroxyacyl-CoA dehydrogenase/enoyl-CoA hydratase/3-hydroxybutyryl-CoA epimerase